MFNFQITNNKNYYYYRYIITRKLLNTKFIFNEFLTNNRIMVTFYR